MVRFTAEGRDRIFSHVHGMAGEVVAISERLDPEQRRTVAEYIEHISALSLRLRSGSGNGG